MPPKFYFIRIDRASIKGEFFYFSYFEFIHIFIEFEILIGKP